MGEQADPLLGTVEFTHRWYRDLLERLGDLGYDFRAFGAAPEPGTAFLRHDVDLSPAAALRMARIEAEHDISGTYCFLVSSPLYNPLEATHRDHLREIEALGHEIGLHFSTHEYWPDERPDRAELYSRIADERAVLDRITTDPVSTVSFHIPPDWVLGESFEGFHNTYAPAYFDEIGYVADSSQRWRTEPPTLSELPDSVQVLTHPGLWAGSDATFRARVERAVSESCTHARQKARREFVEGVGGS